MRALSRLWRWLLGSVAVIVGLGAIALVMVQYAPQKVKALAELVGEGAGLVTLFIPDPLPAATEPKAAHWLNQSWSNRDRFWFHHTSQGTSTLPVPYDWFMELERGQLALFGDPGRLADSAYLQRFGFIPSPKTKIGKFDNEESVKFGYRKDSLPDVHGAADRYQNFTFPDNRDGLPVGFGRLDSGIDPTTREKYPAQIGFTCAACHTGHLEYKNVSIRFDGGPAMLDLSKLEPAIAQAIAYTLKVPLRFGRFAERVAKRDPAWQDEGKLRAALQETLTKIAVTRAWSGQISSTPRVEEGFGRLDALNRIGNQVFFENLLPEDAGKQNLDKLPRVPEHVMGNFVPVNAPVSFPPIWDTPTFLWAQYDASIFNELVRNAGESLGVGAKIAMTGKDANRYFSSSVQIASIVEMERMLRGTDPLAPRRFDGLTAPQWSDAADIFKDDPESAWKIDTARVDEGRKLYAKFCVECHRGPVRDVEFDKLWPALSFWETQRPDLEKDMPDLDKLNWVKFGDRNYFNVVQKPVADMGTDPQQSRVLAERKVTLPANLGVHPVNYLNGKLKTGQEACRLPNEEGINASFGVALMAVVGRTIDKWFAENPTDPVLEEEMRGPRPNCVNPKTFTAAGKPLNLSGEPGKVIPQYRARPLDGVWATAPYLHNGSVPTLREMLTPQDERTKTFCVGSRQFDPRNVGLRLEVPPCALGLTEFKTNEVGNSNRGHSFQGPELKDKNYPRGVIGPELKGADRDNLLEYLKTQ